MVVSSSTGLVGVHKQQRQCKAGQVHGLVRFEAKTGPLRQHPDALLRWRQHSHSQHPWGKGMPGLQTALC